MVVLAIAGVMRATNPDTSEPSAPPAEQTQQITLPDNTELWDMPDAESGTITTLLGAGTMVSIITTTESDAPDGWTEIQAGEIRGWVQDVVLTE